jgi:hypothetical protein
MKKETTRERLVDAIIELGGDEFEHSDDYIKLAKESEDELISRLIDIANYYHDELNA